VTAEPAIEELDESPPELAAATLAPLFEGAPRFLARLIAARPFGSWPRLFDQAREIAHALPEAEQIELVDAHPRLGAPRATVSAMSSREQGYDRAPAVSASAASAARSSATARLERLNDAYEARFGFRYCVFVAGRPLDALVPELEAALAGGAAREAELHRALDAVVDIAIARHHAVSATEASSR
jgi:2-oxo-4-hydroxy-4-carboxy--5-ureidoimidazoline (OHCU) decarboxylase